MKTQTQTQTENGKPIPLTVTDYRCPICGGTDLMVPANWGHTGEPKTGIPACVACGTEFWMDVDGYVEWYTNPPAFPATLFGTDGRIIRMVRDDSDETRFVHESRVCHVCGSTDCGFDPPVDPRGNPHPTACVDANGSPLCGDCRYDGACIFSR